MRRFPFAGTLLILATALVLAMAACGDDDGQSTASPTLEPTTAPVAAAGFPITVTRSDGRELTIEEAPPRIASLSPGATEVLYAVGAGSQIVVTDDYSDYPEEAQGTPKLDAFQPDPEAIVGSEADLIILAHDIDGMVAELDDLGETVLFLETPDSIDGVIEQVGVLARVTGHAEEGERLAQEMRDRISAVTSGLADVDEGPRIYHELDNTFFTVAPDSFVGGFYELLKARNIAEGATDEYPQLTQEEILERDPEIIILADVAGGESAETVKARPGWDAISAVKNDRIYAVDPDILSRPGPRVTDGLEELARLLYPERFP